MNQPTGRLSVWTQGMGPDGALNGRFDPVERGKMTFEEVMKLVRGMPVPASDSDPGEYCPPTLGFGASGTSINRLPPGDGGDFFVFPHEEYADLAGVEGFVREEFA